MEIGLIKGDGRKWVVAIMLAVIPLATAMFSASPALAKASPEECKEWDRQIDSFFIKYLDATFNPELRLSYIQQSAAYEQRMDSGGCMDAPVQSTQPSSPSGPYVEPPPPPVPVIKFPDFDPQNPNNQQMMLMCAGTYAFFTDKSADTNPRDKAAYEAMLAAFQKSRGINKSAAEDLVSEKKGFYGGSVDFSRVDKNRGIEFILNSELGTFEANMADLADQALLCGNTLGIEKPSLIEKYLSVFFR